MTFPKGMLAHNRAHINVGDRFGRLRIIQEGKIRHGRRRFVCICDCGNKKSVDLSHLRRGAIISCGCYRNELAKIRNTKHGLYKSRIYRTWLGMKTRCDNHNVESYKHYGGRGIKLCKQWLSFEAFCKWSMAHGYRDDLTIERKNVNGNYCPTNCTWISQSDQMSNTRRAPGVYFNGQRRSIRQWAKHYGVHHQTVYNRLNRGWSIGQALIGKDFRYSEADNEA